MGKVQVLITRLDPSVPLPVYAKGGDAGADIVSRVDVTLQPGERALVPTGRRERAAATTASICASCAWRSALAAFRAVSDRVDAGAAALTGAGGGVGGGGGEAIKRC